VIELPCDGMVKAYLEHHFPKTDEGVKLTQSQMIGRVMLELLSGKRGGLLHDGYVRTFTSSVSLVVSYDMMKRGRAGVDHCRAREVNELLRQHIREMAFNSCISYLRVNPSGNIRKYMGEWLEANGLYQAKVQLDHMLRSFFNWRKKHHADMLRQRGRYHNYKKSAA
jgi:hypothetical protein